MSFLDILIEKAKKQKKTIVLPETTDIRTLKAADIVLNNGIADIILIGDPKKIQELGGELDLTKAKIVDSSNINRIGEYVNALYELRKHKGVTVNKAKELLQDPLYFGVMMVKMNEADGMVAGAVNSTSNTFRPALQILKTAPDTKLVSSFFLMIVPDCEYGEDGIFLFADCGLVEDPNSEELAEIAISSSRSFTQLTGIESKVAMLSYSTYNSANSVLTQKVVEATRLVNKKEINIKIDGELQADAAIVPSVGKSKAKGSLIAGECNTLIFPDLNSGNISYKLVQRLAKAEAYGLITQGMAKPVNDLSRGCSTKDIVGVITITAVQAQQI